MSGSSGPRSNGKSDNMPINSDGTPAYFRSSSSAAQQSPLSSGAKDATGAGAAADSMHLVGQTIQINKRPCYVRGRVLCGGDDLYAVESDKPMKGYSGLCPRCNQSHVAFTDFDRGFYVAAKNIHDLLQNQKLADERAKGPKRVHELPAVKENLPPLGQPILGKDKGIQGDSNSCYMDATIFCMFAYSDVFDVLLHTKAKEPELQALQTILRDNIVHVLRDKNSGSVQRDALLHLRVQLSEATNDRSFKEVEKDPSEFLRAFETLFHFAPLKTIVPDQPPKADQSNITTNIIWEMFDANPSNLSWTTIAGIFRNSLAEIPAKLATIPPFLVLVAPRHTRSQRSYRYIVPERHITLDNHTLQLVCLKCRKTNHEADMPADFYYCVDCCSKQKSTSPPTTDATIECYCTDCMQSIHFKGSETLKNHAVKRVSDVKHKLNLFAVLCIEVAHYVAFVKCQNRDTQEHQWLFFDSMSDRKYDEENIPLVDTVADFDRWIEAAEQGKDQFFSDLDARRREARPMSQKFNENDMRQLRLFRDGAFFFYENANVNYH